MAAGRVLVCLPGLRRPGPVPVRLTARCCATVPRGSNSQGQGPKAAVSPENQSLLENLALLGVDLEMARQRQPGVLRKTSTNERGLARFLKGKGAGAAAIASIISRYPRAVTRSVDHLDQRWRLWRNVFKTDAEIVRILDRSPESFFRSSDNGNLEKNIAFLTSLGLGARDLHRLLTMAPRTFSNSLELNSQMVELLQDIGAQLGEQDLRQFSKNVICSNVYVLTRSAKRVKANVAILRACLKISDAELLALLQGPGAEVFDLSSEYMKTNFKSLREKMRSLGCGEADLKQLVTTYPMVLYIGPSNLNTKLDCLLDGGIAMKQVLEKPKVLEYSTQNIRGRIAELDNVGYDFQKSGIAILDMSRKRFEAKLKKLASMKDGTLI